MNTKQKRISFSNGQISPELVERTDLALYDKSAQKLENVVATVYGGLRSRRGTTVISEIFFGEETTGTATSYLGGDASHLQDLTLFESSNIGTNRDICSIDYGEPIDKSYMYIDKIKINDLLQFKTATTNGTLSMPEAHEVYFEMVAGGGGGSSQAGGRGAGIKFYANLAESDYTYTVGWAGQGGDAYVRNNDGYPGGSSTITGAGLSVICGGGTGGQASRHGGNAGVTGTISTSFTTPYTIKERTVDGETNALSFFDNTTTGYGAGGQRQPNGTGRGYNGYQGIIYFKLGYIKVNILTSIDGSTWEQKGSFNVTTDYSDAYIYLENFRYVKFVIAEDASFNLSGKLTLQRIILKANSYQGNENIKLIPFAFNNEQKYVLPVTNEKIFIYKDDILDEDVDAAGLLDSYIKDLKFAYKDDTIVLTHPELRTKRLKRTNSGWDYADFEWKNIPFFAFNGETETVQSVSITPSGTDGAIRITAASGIFNAGHVGQYIDGNGGRVRITEYVSPTVVNGITQIPFYTKDAIGSWTLISGYEEAWSVTRGYPRTCFFAQERLIFGGSKTLPAHVWLSRIGDVANFKNAGNYDNDAIDVQLLTNEVIVNIIENRGIHIFTTGQEWSVAEDSLTPKKFSAAINTQNGSLSGVAPIVLGGIVMFVEKNGKSLLTYVYNYDQASYVTDNISLYSSLVQSPKDLAAETNSRKDRGDFVFLALEDGTMLVGCYVLAQNIKAISSFKTEGKIKNVCSIFGDTYITVERKNKVYLEKIDDVRTDRTIKRFADTLTLENLDDYNDYKVYVYDKDGEVYFSGIVSSGTITLNRIPNKNVYIGIAFDYSVESNPIEIKNATYTNKKRISSATLVTNNTSKVTFCGQTKKNAKVYDFYSCTKYGDDVRFTITGEFYPLDLLSVALNLNCED